MNLNKLGLCKSFVALVPFGALVLTGVLCGGAILIHGASPARGASQAPEPETQLDQKAVERTKFGWSKDKATVLYSMSRYYGDYEVQLIRNRKPMNPGWGFEIQFVRSDKTLLSIKGHENTVFKQVKDVVYYADFNPGDCGCTVVAYDLKQQKQLWRSEVRGVGKVMHSAYFNTVNLDADEEAVVIYGHEAYGDYYEVLDARSGKTIGHKIFRTGYARSSQ